jgi:hypothetical protein
MSDGPKFLTGAPEPVQPAIPPVGGAGPFRQPGARPPSLAEVEREVAEREAREAQDADERRRADAAEAVAQAMERHGRRGYLDELFAPHRWPPLARRYPRVLGLVLLVLGLDGVRRIVSLYENGGTYFKTLPITTAVGVLIGGWFTFVGRPQDDEGYTPRWWNLLYIAVCLFTIPAALAIHIIWLKP